MSTLSRRLLPLLFLTTLAVARADNPAPGILEVPNVFSYQLPPGWAKVNLPGGGTTYPTAVEIPAPGSTGGAKAMISVNTDSAPSNLTEWCNKSLAQNKVQFAALNAQLGELKLFPTNNPVVTGFCAPIDLTARGRPIHYVMYFFAGRGNTKIAVTCACPGADASHYVPLFDAAMKTFVPY